MHLHAQGTLIYGYLTRSSSLAGQGFLLCTYSRLADLADWALGTGRLTGRACVRARETCQTSVLSTRRCETNMISVLSKWTLFTTDVAIPITWIAKALAAASCRGAQGRTVLTATLCCGRTKFTSQAVLACSCGALACSSRELASRAVFADSATCQCSISACQAVLTRG